MPPKYPLAFAIIPIPSGRYDKDRGAAFRFRHGPIAVISCKLKEPTMKAAVCYAFGQPLVVEEVESALPQPGEVKVRLAAAAICHSDLHLIRGDWGGALPLVAGHEAAG